MVYHSRGSEQYNVVYNCTSVKYCVACGTAECTHSLAVLARCREVRDLGDTCLICQPAISLRTRTHKHIVTFELY